MRWNPTVHAISRLKERVGIAPENAKNYVNQLMQTAKYVTTNENKLVYHHEKSDLMIVVSPDENKVITVHYTTPKSQQQPQPTPKLTVSSFVQAIRTEMKRMRTQYKREIRKLNEQKAHLDVLVAELTLNKIRCKAPHTQAIIQTRIDEITEQVNRLAEDINALVTQVEKAEQEVKAVLGA